ncbi:hypothetical protein AB205_0061150, partial [Aquarana catesbeiana]
WIKHVDEQGRPYYYSADGSRSEWELPKSNSLAPPHPREITKSRSLDRKFQDPIILTKWRHSTYLLEANDKLLIKQKRNSTECYMPIPGFLTLTEKVSILSLVCACLPTHIHIPRILQICEFPCLPAVY